MSAGFSLKQRQNVLTTAVGAGALVIVVSVLLVTALTQDSVRSANDASRVAAVESLVHRGTFQIDDSPYVATIDKVFVGSHFYSDKQPFFLVLLAGVYSALHHGASVDLASGEVYWLCLLSVGALWVMAVSCLYGVLGLAGVTGWWRSFAALSLAAGSSWLTWSTVINNHAPAASFLMIGFWFHLKGRRDGIGSPDTPPRVHRWLPLLAGFFFAVAGMTDIPTTIFLLGFGVFHLWPRRNYRELACYSLGAAFPIAVAFALNWQIAGDLLPIKLHAEFFAYPGSDFDITNLSGFLRHDVLSFRDYAFDLLIGRFGLLPYNPLLVFALVGLCWQWGSKGPFAREGTVVGLCSAVLVIYYLVATDNYSGWSYGVRWFVPLLPLLSFFAYPLFIAPKPAVAMIYGIALAVAIGIMLLGTVNPWSYLDFDPHPMKANLKTWMAQ